MSAFPSGAPVLEALNAGALDIGFTGDIPFLFIYAAGAPLKAVGAWHFNPATVALVVGRTRRSVRWPASRASALPSIAAAGAFPRPWRVASRRPRTAGRKLFLPWSGGRPRRPGAWLGRRLGALGALYLQRRAARSGAGHRQRCRDHDRLLLCPGQRRCDRPQEGRDQRPADPPGACPGLGPEAPGGVRRGPGQGSEHAARSHSALGWRGAHQSCGLRSGGCRHLADRRRFLPCRRRAAEVAGGRPGVRLQPVRRCRRSGRQLPADLRVGQR